MRGGRESRPVEPLFERQEKTSSAMSSQSAPASDASISGHPDRGSRVTAPRLLAAVAALTFFYCSAGHLNASGTYVGADADLLAGISA